ncbi:MAG: arylsulfatase [Bacteroidota bacterium]
MIIISRIPLFWVSVLATFLSAACQKTEKKPMNVVLVLIDDQGYGSLSCHGNPDLHTPHMDKLWAESVRLTDFHVDPTCSPTRAALHTGRYSHRAHVWHTVAGRERMHPDEMTMAEVFKNSGYHTALFGKWHLGHTYPYRPIDRGFDYSIARTRNWYRDRWANELTDYHKTWMEEGYSPDVFFTHAKDYIRKHKDEPFFVSIATHVPHVEWCVKPEWAEPFTQKGLPASVAVYYASVAQLDSSFGDFTHFFQEEGLEENTILIFMTDNGTANNNPANYNAGMRGAKASIYDGGHRVPCFWYAPSLGINEGRDISKLTAHVDILPTLIDLLELTPTKEVDYDGTSILPLLKDDAAAWPERTLLVESQRVAFPKKWLRSCVMTDKWRMINGNELYDMEQDPGQKTDVAAAHPEVMDTLKAFYEAQWPGLSYRDDEFCRMVLGHPLEPVTKMFALDWLPTQGGTPWKRIGHIDEGMVSNGYHVLDVHTPGTYEFRLRRWFPETNGKISSSIEPYHSVMVYNKDGQVLPFITPAGKALSIQKASVRIAGKEKTIAVGVGDVFAALRFELPAGPAKLEAEFTDKQGVVRGVYHVEVEKVEEFSKE